MWPLTIAALLADARGHGSSGGYAMDFGWWGDRDIAAPVSFLARQPCVHAQPGQETAIRRGARRPTRSAS